LNLTGPESQQPKRSSDMSTTANEIALFVTNQITTMLSYWDKDLFCRYVNEAYEEWFGKSFGEIEGLPIQDLINVDEQSMMLIQRALNGEKVVFERDFSPHGTNRHTLVTYYPDIRDGIVRGFTSHITDITAQKEKELALTASELKFRAILESAPDAIVIADSDGIIRLINSRSEEMFQYTKDELIGQPVELLMPERFRKTHPKKRDSFSSNPHSRPMGNLILFGLRKNGEEFPTDVSLSPLRTNEGMLISAAFRDITWKVEKENELLKSNNEIRDKAVQIESILKTLTEREKEILRVKNNLSAMINATKDLMWSVNADYKLISANQPFCNFVKQSTGTDIVEGDSVLAAMESGNSISRWKNMYDRCLSGRSLIINLSDSEVRFAPIYDSQTDNVIGVACHSLDTEERNQMEKEKIETAQRFTAIVQNGSDLIFIIDENNMPTYISPSVFSHLGYTPDFLYGKSVVDFIHQKDYAKLILIATSSGKNGIQVPAIRIKHADGSWRWIEATIDNLFDNPAVKGLVLNAKDITDRKRKETEREVMIKELTRSNNDMKQFSFITSHNLRAPLSNITGLLALLDYDMLDAGNREILEMVGKSSEQLKNTIDDITEIVVIKNTIDTPMSSLDVHKMFNRVNKNFLNTENDIAAQITFDLEVKEIHFNKTYLESIFINLISNAIKYRQMGTTLKIQLSTYKNEEGRSVLVFSDNGIGIDLVRHKDRVFGMYQRFHSQIDGQGLGLFIVKSQIEALGGKIEIESELNEGTKFVITFP